MPRRLPACLGIGLLAIAVMGCRSIPTLPPADLSETGWRTRHGQAIWRSSRGAPEIAGELLVATNREHRVLIQFTKIPLPFVIAQITDNTWQIEFPAENRTYSGRGQPPVRLAWLHLARCFDGIAPPSAWNWQEAPEGRWQLENMSTGEKIQGRFDP